MLTEMIKNPKNIFEEGNLVAKGNENPLISSDSRFSKISKSDHIHFCSLEAKYQSSSQLSFFPGDIFVPG